jgi:hypothetical protein
MIADMACGAGTFLVELHRLMAKSGRSHSQILAQLLGNDIDPFAVHLASINLVTRDIYRGANYPAVRLGDAFDIEPGVPVVDVQPADGERVLVGWPTGGLDAVVGNPPYAEKPDDVDRLKRRITQLGHTHPTGMQGGNLAAWFFVLASAHVNARGVIAFVMPSGVLQNSNLEVWRTWLRKRFDVTIWHCEDDVWFSDARVATCVILATPRSTCEVYGRLHFVNVQERVEGALVSIDKIASPVTNANVRDISHIDASADLLVEGTCPGLLRQFSAANHVNQIKNCDWIRVFSGNKLGHAFFQLRDLAPANNAVVRRVSGLKMEFDLTKTFLRPLLSSPKDERTGEFRKSQYWVLSAPERLPSRGQVRNYIEAAKKLHVHRAPSVAQRGANWWNVDWRESQIAVQIHPGFLHQVWWSPLPFVAKNNFHTFEFSEGASQADRELVAASLASGWGALSALYVSSEVGCEGVRWLSTAQLQEWPILVPSAVSKIHRTEVIRAFRLFRQLEAREIQSMEPTSVTAWLSLTEAVAQAAGMDSPRRAAEECLALARETCERRTRRETIALAGRMRKTGATGRSLTTHITERLMAMPLAASILVDLTGGDRQLRLRSSAQLAQTAFNFGDEGTTVLGEASIAEVLGAGFECAPISKPEEPNYLAKKTVELINEILLFVVGAAPPEGDAALHTYQETAAEVRKITVHWLRQEVEKRLS